MREWDASTYDRLPLPHDAWGRRTVARLELLGDEHVLEIGSGTGRDTELLLDRLPRGRVTAIDGSAAMLARLRERLASRLDRVDLIQGDLNRPLPLTDPVDAIFSVATLHWLPDHHGLFSRLADVVRPGGQLVVDCGGEGNIASVVRALEELGEPPRAIWNFAGVEATERDLAAAGFEQLDVTLVRDPVTFERGEQLEDYLRTVVLGAQLDRMPEDERPRLVRAVAGRLPEPAIDYVRLNIRAVRRP